MDNLQTKKIILGSASPRRHELLKGLDIDFVIDTKNTFEEIWPEGLPLKEIPEYLSKGKSKGFHRALEQDELLITADTMVLCNDEILGKPKSSEDAKRMLNLLENNKHVVLTGVCIRSTDKIRSFTVSSDVHFGELTDAQIDYYINKYQPFDKAGAYGVQEWIGYVGIKKIDGSYYNVMGLPVHKLYQELINF